MGHKEENAGNVDCRTYAKDFELWVVDMENH
jgi:hypothetical protein